MDELGPKTPPPEQPAPPVESIPPKSPSQWPKLLVTGGIIIFLAVLIGLAVFLLPTKKSPSGEAACTQDAKICPDGSYVSRVPPNCDFAPCPTSASDLYTESTQSATANWKTYTNTEYAFEVKYPNSWFDRGEFQNEYSISNENTDYAGLTKNGVSVSFSRQDSGFALGITEYQTAKEYFDVYSQGEAKKRVFIDNQPAVREWIMGEGDQFYFVLYTILYNDYIYNIVLDGPDNQTVKNNEQIFDQILSTFKFLDQVQPTPTCGPCPQYNPPSEDFCKNGKIVYGDKDKCGCPLPPKCLPNSP